MNIVVTRMKALTKLETKKQSTLRGDRPSILEACRTLSFKRAKNLQTLLIFLTLKRIQISSKTIF